MSVTMTAKLGSSSCRPLLQGMMLLLAVLLLASIQAGPVMALDEQAVADLVGGVVKHGREAVNDVREVVNHGATPALTVAGKLNPAYRRFTNGAKKGIKYHKYWCKAQGWMDKLKPEGGGGSVTPSFVPTLAGVVSRSFPGIFSYSVTSQGIGNVFTCWSNEQQVPAAGTGARITGILVGQETVPVQTPPPAAYLSSLDGPLREAVIRQMKALNHREAMPTFPPPTADELCYAATALSPPLRLPLIAVLLAGDNGGMQTMELGVATDTPVWYPKSSMYCLGIKHTIQLLILGSP